MSAHPQIAVVGGGWAGLAAAVHLSQQGTPVTLFESARQLGGRARCVRFEGLRVDNGQHLMIGAYRDMLRMLRILQLPESDVFERIPLDLHMLGKRQFRLRTYRLPAPLHLLTAIFRARGFSLLDRIKLLRFSERLARGKITLTRDITAQALMIAEQQTGTLIHAMWEPLCLAALNTPLRDASAQLFLNVLIESFTGSREATDFLIPRTDLGTAIPAPSLDYIERKGGKVLLSHRIRSIEPLRDGRINLRWQRGEMRFDHVILAVSPTMCRRLLSGHAALQAISEPLQDIQQVPICTVYLQYPEQTTLDQPIMGLLDGIGQWVFDRSLCGQPGLMAVVISGEGPHMALDNDALILQVSQELDAHFPEWPAPLYSKVIREKRATFLAEPGIDAKRPPLRTPVTGLWLAGDFTATGLPATLEGAIRSGTHCAEAIRSELLGARPAELL